MNRRFFPFFSCSLFRATVGICVLLLTACGGKQTASDSSSPASSTGTGSISFAVEWEPPPATPPAATGKAHSVQPMAPAIDVCTDYGIDTVTMKVLSGDNVLASAGYPCSQHGGTLNNIPAGSNLVLRLEASIPGSGTMVWAGDTAFNLAAGGTEDVGKVSMSYTGTDTTAPYVLSVSPDNNATNVLETSEILIRFTERMAINTVQDNEAILVTDNVSGRVAGVVAYSDNTALFTPAAPLGSGRKHTVTVGTSVTDIASRAMITPYVSNFSVHKKWDWFNPTLIEENNTAGTYSPQVAINGNGDAVAVWQQSDGTQVNIWANRYSSSTKKWEIPTLVEQSSGDQEDPRVVVDGTGNAIVVWRSKFSSSGSFGDLTGYKIMSTQYSAQTGTWKPPGEISLLMFNYGLPPSGYDKHDPRIAIDGTGNAVAIWIQDNNVWANRYTASTELWNHNISFEPLATVIENITDVSSNPEIAMDLSGNAIAVWQQDGGGQKHIWANRYSASTGTWGAAALIDNHVIGFAESPKVAMDGNGNAVVVWGWAAASYPPPLNYNNIWSNRYMASSGTWETPTQIQGSTDHAILQQVAVDGSGNATAVWILESGLWTNRYTASTGIWGTAATRIVDGTGGIHLPALGMDGTGNAIVLWGNNPASKNIWSSRYVKETGTWGTATVLNNGAGSAAIPQISVNQGGNAVAVWLQADEFRYNLWANQFE